MMFQNISSHANRNRVNISGLSNHRNQENIPAPIHKQLKDSQPLAKRKAPLGFQNKTSSHENSANFKSKQQGVSKTPSRANSSGRRALGDISNRKQNIGGRSNVEDSKSFRSSNISRSVTFNTPHIKSKASNKITKNSLKKKRVLCRKTATTPLASHARQDFVYDERMEMSIRRSNHCNLSHKARGSSECKDHIDNIEVLAGRSWIEEERVLSDLEENVEKDWLFRKVREGMIINDEIIENKTILVQMAEERYRQDADKFCRIEWQKNQEQLYLEGKFFSINVSVVP
mmetsp:Transcript_872/g.1342  ORF Transcript_872/g.1342 Transcript_872/m.1342 type:complete len:287 (+) Transcript_872:191-1051(+)